MTKAFPRNNPVWMMVQSGAPREPACRSARSPASVAWCPTPRARRSRGRSSPRSARACRCWSTSSPPTASGRVSPTPRCGPPTPVTSPGVWSTWRRTSSSARSTAAPTGPSRCAWPSATTGATWSRPRHVETSVHAPHPRRGRRGGRQAHRGEGHRHQRRDRHRAGRGRRGAGPGPQRRWSASRRSASARCATAVRSRPASSSTSARRSASSPPSRSVSRVPS